MFDSKEKDVPFEEAISDDWSRDLGVAEEPLTSSSFYYLSFAVLLVALVAVGRVFFININRGDFYANRAEANSASLERVLAPRGLILDSYGTVLADNEPVFLAFLKVGEFLRSHEIQEKTFGVVQDVFGFSREEILGLIESNDYGETGDDVLLSSDLSQEELVKLKGFSLPTISISSGFKRRYAYGPVFSSVIGYTGVVSSEDLDTYPDLTGKDFVGKSGIELMYEDELRGRPGSNFKVKDARGNVLEEKVGGEAEVGKSVKLSIDGEFQRYFYTRLEAGLRSLGRSVGVGLAMNPKTGEILALVNLPSYDNNVFSSSGRNEEKVDILSSPLKPLFNRAVAGVYSPGSTIKPLVGVAALEEGVVTPDTSVFSPGYLDVPNPYNPDKPTRFLDWRFQGEVNLAAALAQSSNVYFYIAGGGSPEKSAAGGIKGLGINRLLEWWKNFGLGSLTGVDLPGEAEGFLPNMEEKEERTGVPWLLGDTYNVSIGQGDLLVTPLQLLNYISAIANGGKLYKPSVTAISGDPEVIGDVSSAAGAILEVRKGMRRAVTSQMGTAKDLNDLPFKAAGKTGSAQVTNNAEENAFFVGYAPADESEGNPRIAILVLIENSKQGSLNAVPIAKDVLGWYYKNRLEDLPGR